MKNEPCATTAHDPPIARNTRPLMPAAFRLVVAGASEINNKQKEFYVFMRFPFEKRQFYVCVCVFFSFRFSFEESQTTDVFPFKVQGNKPEPLRCKSQSRG